MRNMFSVKCLLLLCGLAFRGGSLVSAATSTQDAVALALDGAVPTEPLLVHGKVIVTELHRDALVQLSPGFRRFSIVSEPGDAKRILLLTNRRSRMGNGSGYCGSGHELELHLVAVTPRSKVLDTYALEGCLAGTEIQRDTGLTVTHDGVEFRRFCDPSDVIVRLTWGAGKFKRSFAWTAGDSSQRLSALIQRSSLQPGKADTLNLGLTDGSDLGALLTGASEVRMLRKWHQANKDILAVEVRTNPADGSGGERHLLVIDDTADGHPKLRQFIEVSRFGEDARVMVSQAPEGGALLLPLKCGDEMIPLKFYGGLLQVGGPH